MIRILLALLIPLLVATPAMAVLELEITRGRVEPIPIALPSIQSDDKKLAEKIRKVIEDDLRGSGLFYPLERKAHIQKSLGVDEQPRFDNWRKVNVRALLAAELTVKDGTLSMAFRLWDVPSQKQSAGKSFSAPERSWRRLGHRIADIIYSRLTGEEPYFDSRIVYVAQSGHWKNPVKKLAIMDQDGANQRYLTSGKFLVLTPRFDPNTQRIIYLSYERKVPSVFIYNIATGEEEVLGQFEGMSFAPRFSPDGKKAIMSVSVKGNSEIYEMDIRSRRATRLTRHSGIDTSPSYSPDGRNIVFNSNRQGTQQLYVMDRYGDNVKRISFGKGSYGTPAWSPRGDLIAFTRLYQGKFYIGVMRPDGSGERLLTESYLDEGPTWSPNGRVLLFSRKERDTRTRLGKSRLYSIDLTGYNEKEIPTPSDAIDPAWSPILSK